VSARITLEEARAVIARAVEKSREVDWLSAYAVADEGGNIVSISRLDGAPAVAVPLARSKAYLAALTGKTSLPFELDVETHPLRFHGYQSVLTQPVFGGPGAVPIRKDGVVVGGFSSSTSYANPGMQTVVNGKQYSREELVTAHALQIPYDEQHPDTP
jgi:uncharacterized protein GlcG (DUF336 family)